MRRFAIVLIVFSLAAPAFAADVTGGDPGWMATILDWITGVFNPESYGGMISPDG